MVCIAIERFCAVWLPHKNKTIFTHKTTFFLALIVVFISTVSSLWFIFVIKMARIPTLSMKNSNNNNLFHLNNHTINDEWKCTLIHDNLYDSLGMFSVIMNYVLPFIFVFALNSAVIYRLCQRGIVELRSSITVMLTLVCLIHLFCMLPFQCWWIYYEIFDRTGDCSWLKQKLIWRIITFTIRNTNYMANFFLYWCSSKLFRAKLKSLIFLHLLPHEQYGNYRFRRQSLHDSMQQQNFSLSHLIMLRLSRITECTNSVVINSV